MIPDADTCYAALRARDARFDGRFYVGVVTTGIYCRPICAARTPKRENVRFYATAAGASAAGLRACRRCRPDTVPGSRNWDHSGDLAQRALRLIGSGFADEVGVAGLAGHLFVSERQLRRVVLQRSGATPKQLIQTRRAQTARLLIDQTTMTMAEVSLTAGFGSLRQFNEVIQQEFGASPTDLRRSAGPHRRTGNRDDQVPQRSRISLRLAHRDPYGHDLILRWWARHAIAGMDSVGSSTVATRFANGDEVAVRFVTSGLQVEVDLADITTLPDHIATLRAAFDLDAQPAAIGEALAADPHVAPLVAASPGLRVPAALDPWRGAAMAVLGQQVSVAAATGLGARLAAHLGDPTRFPGPARVCEAGAESIGKHVRMPRTRAAALVELATLVGAGEVDLGPAADREAVQGRLLQVRGIGPWTAAEIRLRALRDPDVWPAGDVVLARAARELGGVDPGSARPWRSYLAHHLWAFAHDRTPPRKEAAR